MEMRAAINLCEMAYDRQTALAEIIGLRAPINDHLAKVVCVDDPQNRSHWRGEILNWLLDIAQIRLKPKSKPGAFKLYYEPLFDGPFGHAVVENSAALMERLSRKGFQIDPSATPQMLGSKLGGFHKDFATLCSTGRATKITVEELLAKHFSI